MLTQNLDGYAGTKWPSLSVLAHEMGHHYRNHTIDRRGSTPPKEIEADYFSGYVMAKLLEQARGKHVQPWKKLLLRVQALLTPEELTAWLLLPTAGITPWEEIPQEAAHLLLLSRSKTRHRPAMMQAGYTFHYMATLK